MLSKRLRKYNFGSEEEAARHGTKALESLS
jgi:hypothetical protein